MYRVIVVDDEIYAADSLRDYIVSHCADRYDVYSVYTASSALELMGRSHFDIVLTDIRMPGMDGLALLKQIRRGWPVCRVILMSGYDSFEYIYEAMKEGGSAYILKSEIYELILGELHKASKSIENELSAALESYESASPQECDASGFRQYFSGDRWSELINQLTAFHISGEAEVGELCALNFPIQNSPLSIALFQMSSRGLLVVDWNELIRLANGLMQLYRRIAGDSLAVYVTVIKPHMVLMLIQARPGAQLAHHQITASVERLQTAAKYHMRVDADTLVHHAVPSFAALHSGVDRLKNAYYHLEVGSGRLIDLTGAPLDREGDGDMNRYDHTHYLMVAARLSAALEKEDAREVIGCLSVFSVCFDSPAGMLYTPLVEVYMGIASALLSYITKRRLYDKVNGALPLYKLFRLEEFGSWREAYIFLRHIARELLDFEAIAREKPGILKQVVAFIDENIESDLSLIRIGMAVGLNSSYLSRLFHKETGQTLSSYITQRRVRHACALLANDELRTSQIAERIGFASVNYFHSFFKKETGMTPHKYREIIRTQDESPMK